MAEIEREPNDRTAPEMLVQMQEELAALRAEVAALRAERKPSSAQATTPAPTSEQLGAGAAPATVDASSRRQLLRRGAVALGAGVAVAGLSASPVAAADGDNVQVGASHDGTGTTRVTTSAANGVGLSGINTAASGTSHGLQGQSSSPDGFGVEATNAALSGATRGVSGTVSSPAGFGVHGTNLGTTGSSTAVFGSSNSPSGIGVHGTTTTGGSGAVGVRGDGDYGVAGIGNFGVSGDGSYGAVFRGSFAQLILTTTSGGVPNTTDSPLDGVVEHFAGEIYFDGSQNLWVCVAQGTPGTWRRLGGPATAGAVHLVGPKRGYDARNGDGPIPTGSSRVLSLANGIDLDGNVDVVDLIPSGATGVLFNISVVNTTQRGFLSVTSGAATSAGAASINWFGDGQVLNNGTLAPLDGSRQVKVWAGGLGTADFVIDITGYTL